MLDSNDLLNSIKKAATDAVEAGNPVNILYGIVTSTSPLKINVEQKMILEEPQLILTRNVTDYTVDVTIAWSTNTIQLNANHSHELTGDISISSSGTINPNPDNESIDISNEVSNSMKICQKNINLSHEHSISGTKKMEIHNGLKLNEKVLLLRMQGGQEYIVLDRVK